MWTNDQLFFIDKSAFWTPYLFREIILESWECGLYTSAAYTWVLTVIYFYFPRFVIEIVVEEYAEITLSTVQKGWLKVLV